MGDIPRGIGTLARGVGCGDMGMGWIQEMGKIWDGLWVWDGLGMDMAS